MTARLVGLLLMACMIVSSCKSDPYKAYPGPKQAADQVAMVSLHPRGELITFAAVDDASIKGTQHDILVLPGQHSILVRAYVDTAILGKHLMPPQEKTVAFEALAGHAYTVETERKGFSKNALCVLVVDEHDGSVVADVR